MIFVIKLWTFLYYTGEGSAATKESGKASVCDLLYCFGIDMEDSRRLAERNAENTFGPFTVQSCFSIS